MRPPLDAKLLKGVPVVDDPTSVSPDVEFVCDGDEIEDLDWRLLDVPILDLFPGDQLIVKALHGESPEDADARWAHVRAWMAETGAEDALRSSPILLIAHQDGLEFVDGWHRCTIAFREHGATHVRALVGSMPALAAHPDSFEM